MVTVIGERGVQVLVEFAGGPRSGKRTFATATTDLEGKPIFAVPFSFLGVPALSLPLLKEQNLPLGFQVTGFANRDADAFAVAGFVTQALGGTA